MSRVVRARQMTVLRSSPIPPAEELARYGDIYPAAPERIIDDFLMNTQHRRKLEIYGLISLPILVIIFIGALFGARYFGVPHWSMIVLASLAFSVVGVVPTIRGVLGLIGKNKEKDES